MAETWNQYAKEREVVIWCYRLASKSPFPIETGRGALTL